MEKKNSLPALLIIFIIATLCLGGYVIYDKFIEKGHNDDSCPKCETYNCTANGNCEKAGTSGEQLLSTNLGDIFIASNGEVYFEPHNTSNIDMKKHAKNAFGLPKTYEPKSDKFPYPVVQIFSYKLDLSEVRSATEVTFGNGATDYNIMFIHNNGSISELSYYVKNGDDDSGNIKLYKNISGYSNIVSVAQDSDYNAQFAKLYDKCGNGIEYHSQRYSEN